MELTIFENKDIAIIGHDNPDIDSIVSGIMLNKLFCFLGMRSRFVILDNIVENKIKSILLRYNINVSDYFSTLEEEYLLLVDHHKTSHAGTVLGVIDHHVSMFKPDYQLYINETCAATSIHIYRLMDRFNYPFSKEDITLILLAAYTDTCSLKSSKVTELDKKDISNLLTTYNIDENLLIKDGYLLRDLSSMSVLDMLNNGLKYYDFGDVKFNSSYLRIENVSSLNGVELSIILKARELLKTNDIDFWVVVFVCLCENRTFIMNIHNEAVSTHIHEGILSRGRDIIPKLEKKYSGLAV